MVTLNLIWRFCTFCVYEARGSVWGRDWGKGICWSGWWEFLLWPLVCDGSTVSETHCSSDLGSLGRTVFIWAFRTSGVMGRGPNTCPTWK